ncbi:hypothetical protein PM082_009173 [Marasmius tenuissimus]|nr:hypothetical protein PM082_009173 [Marasmius tenuissimus]
MPRPGETRGEYRARRAAAPATAARQRRAPRQHRAPRTRAARRATVESEDEPENEPEQEFEEPQVPQDYGAEIDALFRELVAEIESMNFEEPEEGSSQGRTRRPNIMLPKVITLPPVHNVPDIRSSSERRNPRRQSEQKPSEYQHHLKNGLRFIQKFTLPFTFDELVAKSKNKKATLDELEQEVKEMEKESYAIQAGSALFYTKDKVLVFVYLGCRTSDMITTIGDDNFLELSQCSMEERLQLTLERKEAEIREAEEQQLLAQSNRRRHGQRPPKTPSSSTKNMMERLYITSHFMAAYNIPKGDTSRKRHGIDHDGHTYHYFDIEEGIEFTEDENQSRNMVFSKDGGKTALNSAGVFHMAEAWPQAKHKKNELYMGSALSGSGQSTLGTRYFYQANEVLEKCVAIAVKAFFPEIHEIGAKVREAGRTVPTSDGKPCGMYLARAIIFKLQVLLHKDDNDFGVSTSFPCGFFEDGYLIVPQLKSKFRYAPGDLAIFYASLLFHKVMKWKTPKMKKDDVVAPGRVGVVMFNPSASVEELKDKEAKHSERTMFGRLPNIAPTRKEMGSPPAKRQRTK